MNHTQILPFFKAKNHNKINFLSTYAKIDSSNNESFNMNQQEAMSIARAKDALTIISPKESLQALANFETLKAALRLYFQRNNTEESSENIKTIPTFCKSQIEREVLSNEVKDTFARISERVRKEFIEEQIARADQYNIPYNAYTVNFLELKQKIDEYEELLKKAKDHCIDWDKLEYDPVALRQEIEEQERRASYENDDLYAYFVHSRGLEA